MAETTTIMAAIEDMSTASIVAVETARVAIECHAEDIVLMHVLDHHAVLNAVLGMHGYCEPVHELREQAEDLLSLAQQAIAGEYQAHGGGLPRVRFAVEDGDIATAIARIAHEEGAGIVVLGARRPHAFGRLVHPDVRITIAHKLPAHVQVHIAYLQEMPAGVRL